MSQIIKIGVLKTGCVGSSSLLEFLFDERAERSDIEVEVSGTGPKIGVKQCKEAACSILLKKPHLVLYIGPGQSISGPKEVRKILQEADIPTIVISDGPTIKIAKELTSNGFGYIIIGADSMIGARREFLDPVEMVLYNTDVMKVLAITGVLRILVDAIDRAIQCLKKGEPPELPHIVVDKEKAVEAGGFENPYARSKAMAAYEISRHVAELNVEGCFRIRKWEKYIPIVAAGHEMMRIAAKLAEEAREIEKYKDSVLRRPHYDDGTMGEKRKLIAKPVRQREDKKL